MRDSYERDRKRSSLPAGLVPAIAGMAVGALALGFVGFTWLGWTTPPTADLRMRASVDAAVVGALAPVCAARFRSSASAAANLDLLKKVDSWSRGAFIEKGGWATMPGTSPSGREAEVARACANLLSDM